MLLSDTTATLCNCVLAKIDISTGKPTTFKHNLSKNKSKSKLFSVGCNFHFSDFIFENEFSYKDILKAIFGRHFFEDNNY